MYSVLYMAKNVSNGAYSHGAHFFLSYQNKAYPCQIGSLVASVLDTFFIRAVACFFQ